MNCFKQYDLIDKHDKTIESKYDNKIFLKKISITTILLLLTLWIAHLFFGFGIINGHSMEPTLCEKNVVFISKYYSSFSIGEYKRGDLITFQSPFDDINRIFCKRIIGVPGDEIRFSKGDIYINGEHLDEPYLYEDTVTHDISSRDRIIVPNNHIYVLGDNREKSEDSRYFGYIPIDQIKGKIYFRLLPLNKFGKIE